MSNEKRPGKPGMGIRSTITTVENPPLPPSIFELEEWSANQWCPTLDGSGPATQLHLVFKVKGARTPFVFMFKTRGAFREFMSIMEQNGEEVWPTGEPKRTEVKCACGFTMTFDVDPAAKVIEMDCLKCGGKAKAKL